MKQKGFSNIALLVIGLIIAFVAIGFFTANRSPKSGSQNTVPAPSPAPANPSGSNIIPNILPTPPQTPTPVPAVACGIHIATPQPNETVSGLVNVSGYIDGQCHWTAFEGQTGTVRIYDSNGSPVSATAVLTASSDWMQLPVNFTAKVTVNTPPQHTPTGYLLFLNEDPSGQYPETYQVPIRFQ